MPLTISVGKVFFRESHSQKTCHCEFMFGCFEESRPSIVYSLFENETSQTEDCNRIMLSFDGL